MKMITDRLHIAACRPVTSQLPRNEQLYNGRNDAAACKQQQKNGVFYAVRAYILAGPVSCFS
jgi:hypothetical protein